MHYVCSDIHGNLNRYNQMIHTIKSEDTLYILGDVIDRGPDGIEILKDIMKRENVELLLGNHEDMMIRSLLYDDDEVHLVWVQLVNGGGITEFAFNSELPQMQKNILDYLENRALSVKIDINGKTYVLCHSGTCRDKENLLYINATEEEKYDILWRSPFRSDLYIHPDTYNPKYHYIIGHVPVQKLGSKVIITIPDKLITDIDCGCAYSSIADNTSLALLCLEDFSCKYFE